MTARLTPSLETAGAAGEPMPTPLRILTGVGATFSASHRDHVRKQLHGHSYEVTAWFAFPDQRDATMIQKGLEALVKTWDHTTLSDEMSCAEAIASAIIRLLPWCVEVEVGRPLERLYARAKVFAANDTAQSSQALCGPLEAGE